jgi:hypothetical protein
MVTAFAQEYASTLRLLSIVLRHAASTIREISDRAPADQSPSAAFSGSDIRGWKGVEA